MAPLITVVSRFLKVGLAVETIQREDQLSKEKVQI